MRTSTRGSSSAPWCTALQVASRDVDHAAVDLAQRDAADRRMLEELLRRAAVAAADDQCALRRRVRERSHVHEVLVIEELVALRGHEVAVEPEQPPERGALVHLDLLELRAEALETPARTNEEAPLVREVLGHQVRREIAGRRASGAAPAQASLPPRWMAWNFVRSGLSAASIALNSTSALAVLSDVVVADVDVDRHEAVLGPGVDREVRLGEQHRAGDALRLELMETLADDGETGLLDRLHTDVAQRLCAREFRRLRQGSHTIRLTDGFRPLVAPRIRDESNEKAPPPLARAEGRRGHGTADDQNARLLHKAPVHAIIFGCGRACAAAATRHRTPRYRLLPLPSLPGTRRIPRPGRIASTAHEPDR